MSLRAVIFGAEGILFTDSKNPTETGLKGSNSKAIRAEIRLLFDFVRSKSLLPIVVSNRLWTASDPTTGQTQSIDEWLRAEYGDLVLYVAHRGDIPPKPRAASLEAVLAKHDLSREQVVMVGMSDHDFQAANNAQILFLNANWDRKESRYGFKFTAPRDVILFIDVFALREHHWFYAIDDPVVMRSLAPYSTMRDESKAYSEAAFAALKAGTKDRHFFLRALAASIYFSGLGGKFHYIAAIPHHGVGFGNAAFDDILREIAGMFDAKYLQDLIVRHSQAPSQRQARNARQDPSVLDQFNTMHLTRLPMMTPSKRYKIPPLRGKTVLVVDDFTTHGNTFEAARHYLAAAGASVICVSVLKTINRGYRVVSLRVAIDPFTKNTLAASAMSSRELRYGDYVIDREATTEMDVALQKYRAFK
jgi:hypothetical protein